MKDFLKAVKLEVNCIKILSVVEKVDFVANNASLANAKIEIIKELMGPNFELKGITPIEIANLYFNRHERYLNGEWSTSKEDSASLPVFGNRDDKCKWPLGCHYTGRSDLDHILPVCAMKVNVRKFYDPVKNSLTLCPLHNRIVKRDSIAIGLWLREFIIFK